MSQRELKHPHSVIDINLPLYLKTASTSRDFERIKNSTTTNKLSIEPQKGTKTDMIKIDSVN